MHRFSFQELKDSDGALFVDTVRVRFQDIDAAGIVFFARFFDYFHGAYEGLLESAGCPLDRVIAERSWAAPLRHAEADYLSPLRFGDEIEVKIARIHVDSNEIVLGYRVVKSDGTLAAVGQTVHAFLDPKSWQRRDVPAEILDFVAALG